LGLKRSRPPRKTLRNALPHKKKIISRTFKIRGTRTLVFLCPKERERERESKKEKGKEGERTQELAMIFIKRPHQNEKSSNCTCKSGIVCS
jgi:hypothetical protein